MPIQAPQNIFEIIFLIFAGTAILSTAALFTRQSLLVAYILLGMILGPWGLKLINNLEVIEQTGNIGIIFLLFLLGLDLQPQTLFHSLRKMSLITLISSIIFFTIAYIVCLVFGLSLKESEIVGLAMMFSSTIIGIKLLPTTVLHHKHIGALTVSILLLQDLIAIFVLLILETFSSPASLLNHFGFLLTSLPVLFLVAYVVQRYILFPLFARFDQIHEYIFILSIGWCLCMAELSHFLGLSEAIGALIAGVGIASNPMCRYVSESLKPLRDFFLVMFFFTIGASFSFNNFSQVIMPALALATLCMILKPLIFNWLLSRTGEVNKVSFEVGVRLGQMSEFSLLIAYLALQTKALSLVAYSMIQATVIITFIVSSYWISWRYPTPLALSEKLQRD